MEKPKYLSRCAWYQKVAGRHHIAVNGEAKDNVNVNCVAFPRLLGTPANSLCCSLIQVQYVCSSMPPGFLNSFLPSAPYWSFALA